LLVAFNLVRLDGEDMRERPLEERRAALARLIAGSATAYVLSHVSPWRRPQMLNAFFIILLAAALWMAPGAVFAQSGDSSSFGTIGLGPVVPTISLTPRDRWWNFTQTPLWQAEAGSEWLRTHGKTPFPSPFGPATAR
jgi:hypothetical protein